MAKNTKAAKKRVVGRAVVGATRNAKAKPMAAPATVVDAGAALANDGRSHLPQVDRGARAALKLVGAALAGLTGLDSGESAKVAAAVVATDAL